MKKAPFISLFISTHILFILLIIYKQNQFIQLCKHKQAMEKTKEQLTIKKKEYTHERYALHNHALIKQFATSIGLKPITISQVKKCPASSQSA